MPDVVALYHVMFLVYRSINNRGHIYSSHPNIGALYCQSIRLPINNLYYHILTIAV